MYAFGSAPFHSFIKYYDWSMNSHQSELMSSSTLRSQWRFTGSKVPRYSDLAPAAGIMVHKVFDNCKTCQYPSDRMRNSTGSFPQIGHAPQHVNEKPSILAGIAIIPSISLANYRFNSFQHNNLAPNACISVHKVFDSGNLVNIQGQNREFRSNSVHDLTTYYDRSIASH